MDRALDTTQAQLDAYEAEALRWLEPDETAAQLLARTFVAPLRTGLPLVDRFTSFRGGQLLEIASAAGGGRTTCLLQVAATCILPQALDGVAYGGSGAHALFYDLDGKLDILRLLEMLDARVAAARHAAGAPPDGPAEEAVVRDCLTRLHVGRCHSSFSFLASLRSLRPTLDTLCCAPGGLACLLIDNVAAYHYLDKAVRGGPAPTSHVGGGPGGGGGPAGCAAQAGAPLTMQRVHAALAAELRAVQRRYRLPIIATKHLLFSGGSWETRDQQQDAWQHRDTMLKPWQELVTHRLLLRGDDDGGGGGGGGSSGVRLAKWHTPEDPSPIRFAIDTPGIRLC